MSDDNDQRHEARRKLFRKADSVIRGDQDRKVIHLRRSEKGKIYVDAFSPDGND